MNYMKITDVMIDIQLKTPLEIIVNNIKADAIEEFVKALEEHQQKNWVNNLEYGITFADIEEVAEQLKEKKE